MTLLDVNSVHKRYSSPQTGQPVTVIEQKGWKQIPNAFKQPTAGGPLITQSANKIAFSTWTQNTKNQEFELEPSSQQDPNQKNNSLQTTSKSLPRICSFC